jgi:hypothetical protein
MVVEWALVRQARLVGLSRAAAGFVRDHAPTTAGLKMIPPSSRESCLALPRAHFAKGKEKDPAYVTAVCILPNPPTWITGPSRSEETDILMEASASALPRKTYTVQHARS